MLEFDVSVFGLVQGVFFRASALDKATSLGIVGWIKNCPDGSVRSRIQGSESACKDMVAWFREGSDTARVRDVQVTACEGLSDFSAFEIVAF